jgi:serine/threonine-protein kinase
VSDVIADLRKVLMDPLTDLYEEEEEEKNVEIYKTRPISREELNSLQDAVAAKEEEDRIEASSRTQRKKRASRDHFEDDREDVTTQFDRIITVFGIIAAILIVAVVLFVFSRFIGLFDFKGTSTKESTAISTEASQGEVDVSISDNQTPMPDVLGLPEDMAEAKLKESTLVMRVAASEYSDNYPEGQVMSQEIAKGEIVEKWSTVDVTVSKGSDKVDLQKLSLLQMTAEEAQTLLRSKGLVVVRRDEVSATVEKGDVIRFSPDIAKVGESVTLFVSSGTQNVTGQVPALTGKDATTADALLAGAGLTVGTVTYEKSETVEEGLIISQSAAEGTTLEPGTAVDYVVSGTQPGGENSDQYYIGSIDTTCSLSNYIGPAAKTSSVRVLVRLKQTLNGDDVYTTLINARLVVGAQTIPIVIPRIKGAYGVDNGIVEVVDADNLNVISSYPVTFFPAG